MTKSGIVGFVSLAGVIALGLSATAQETIECVGGEAWIPNDSSDITLRGDCADVAVSGNGNTIKTDRIGSLTLMGDGNVINAVAVRDVKSGGDRNTVNYGGDTPTSWFGGSGNKLNQTRISRTSPMAPKAPSPQTKTSRKAPPKAGKDTAVKRQDIVEVIYAGDLSRFDILVMLKDGTARFNPRTPIEHMDVAADKAKYPKSWRQWRRKGGKIQVRYLTNGTWTNLTKPVRKSVKPARSNLTLSGKWKHASSSGYTMTGGSAYFANYVFKSGKRFESSSSSLMTAGTPGVSSSGAASSCDKTGQRSASSSTSAGGTAGSRSRGKGCGAANVGTYAISGYTIEFYAEDGKIYRKPFYLLGDKLAIIGGRWFDGDL